MYPTCGRATRWLIYNVPSPILAYTAFKYWMLSHKRISYPLWFSRTVINVYTFDSRVLWSFSSLSYNIKYNQPAFNIVLCFILYLMMISSCWLERLIVRDVSCNTKKLYWRVTEVNTSANMNRLRSTVHITDSRSNIIPYAEYSHNSRDHISATGCSTNVQPLPSEVGGLQTFIYRECQDYFNRLLSLPWNKFN